MTLKEDQVTVAVYRMREAIRILESVPEIRRKAPWYSRWLYQSHIPGAATAIGELSKGLIAIDYEKLFADHSPGFAAMKEAEKRLYENHRLRRQREEMENS